MRFLLAALFLLIVPTAAVRVGAVCAAAGRESLLSKHLTEVKAELGTDFNVEAEWPFVVATDKSPQFLQRVRQGTVRASYDAFCKNFFDKRPKQIITVYLFKDANGYSEYTSKRYGHEPTTPFGFFVAVDHSLIMNISTGTGTLVHEIAHPLLHLDFPECPTWFDEGFASLFERCTIRHGEIKGLVNWRLPIIQKALRDNAAKSFEELTSTSSDEFYNENRGVCYAQARYLCLYLQEKGLLKKFYKEFRGNVADDPTGYETLQKVIATPIDQFHQDWKKWVLKLRWRR